MLDSEEGGRGIRYGLYKHRWRNSHDLERDGMPPLSKGDRITPLPEFIDPPENSIPIYLLLLSGESNVGEVSALACLREQLEEVSNKPLATSEGSYSCENLKQAIVQGRSLYNLWNSPYQTDLMLNDPALQTRKNQGQQSETTKSTQSPSS